MQTDGKPSKRQTITEAEIATLNPEQLRVLENALDLPSIEADPDGFRRKLQKSVHSWRFRKGGLTPGEFVRMLIEQRERCAICHRLKNQSTPQRWYVDHAKGSPPTIRGILCNACNLWLGAGETPNSGNFLDILKRAEAYVYNPPARRAGIQRIVTFDGDRKPIELSENQIRTARHFESIGLPIKDIAKKLNVRPHTISRYKRKGLL